MFFRGWFSDEYLDTWFDPANGGTPPPSGNGGISKSVFLGTVAPRPVLPPWRQIPGPTGSFLTDIRNVLGVALTQDHLWGNHVTVTFPGAGTSVKINTGLGGPLKGYKVVRADADIRVWDASPGAPSEERGVHWLQSSGAGKVTLYVY